jgi:hypothetical protein
MDSANEGTCNRYAPKPSQATQGEAWAEWPLVMPSDWCGEWAAPLSDDELFADYLARNASGLPTFNGIPVLPTDQPQADPLMITYDHPFEDPLR